MEVGKREIEKLEKLIKRICHLEAKKEHRSTSNFVSQSGSWDQRVEDFAQEVFVRILKRKGTKGPADASLGAFVQMHENQQATYIFRVVKNLTCDQGKKGDVLLRKNIDTDLKELPSYDADNSWVIHQNLEKLTVPADYDWREDPQSSFSEDEIETMQKFERIRALVKNRAFKKLTDRQKDLVRYYLTSLETELGTFRITRQEFADFLEVQPKTLDVWSREGRIEKLKKIPSTLYRFDGSETPTTRESNGNGKTTYFDFVQAIGRLLNFEESKNEVGS